MAEPSDSTSLVVEILLKGLARELRGADRADLEPYVERAAKLDGGEEAERRRGEQCVAWVREVTEAEHTSAFGRLQARVLEDAREVVEAVDAALLDVEHLGPTRSGFHLELNRTFAALKTAEKIAAAEGWDAVPWRSLLDRLFAVSI